ncbi:MAG: DUF3311 domain-containing protein [Thermoproteota archaeon]|nr:DUF3311 domain-containing protein [Thermoproteota archaeon]
MKPKTRYVILAVLILIPTIINLLTPLYNRKLPELFGMPFFYWFQTVWISLCSGFYLGFARLMSGVKDTEEETLNR